MFETLEVTQDSRGVVTVALNRPDKHNALNARMMDELTQCAEQLSADETVRVVVLTGQGKSFCAGGDLGWMRDQMQADDAGRRAEGLRLAHMLRALFNLSKPLIGRVQGNAFGGGVGMCCVCDTVVASNSALFGLTETRLGLIPATIGPYVVARLGAARAGQIFMSSVRFDAQRAMRLGIVQNAVAPDDLDAATEAEVTPYLSCAPGAVSDAKRLLRRLGPQIDDQVLADTVQALTDRWQSPEARDGIAAFFDKRKPGWIAD